MSAVCAFCKAGLVRQISYRIVTPLVTGAFGYLFGRRTGAAVGACLGYVIADQLDGWLCGHCGRRYPRQVPGCSAN